MEPHWKCRKRPLWSGQSCSGDAGCPRNPLGPPSAAYLSSMALMFFPPFGDPKLLGSHLAHVIFQFAEPLIHVPFRPENVIRSTGQLRDDPPNRAIINVTCVRK